MTIASMTGFARAEGAVTGEKAGGDARWVWEIKSVNGRNLDIRARLPGGCDRFDPIVRKQIQQSFKRGSFSIGLSLIQARSRSNIRVNRDLLDSLRALVREIRADSVPAADADTSENIEALLALRGVLEEDDAADAAGAADGADVIALDAAISKTLEDAVAALAAARMAEGDQLATVIGDQLAQIDALRVAAEACAAAQPEALQARLEEQLAALLGEDSRLPEERLAQEVALLVTKSDVREELDRLAAHIAAARELISGGGVIGRKLDFLCQEFNREANTLCSKAPDRELSDVGLELKVVIDQLREQVQNIE